MTVGSNSWSNNHASNLRSQMASQLAIPTAMYFAFVELSAMEVCFLLNQDIITDPKLKQHHWVLFLFVALPAQFESEYPCIFTSPSPIYLIPYSTVPLNYLSVLLLLNALAFAPCIDSRCSLQNIYLAWCWPNTSRNLLVACTSWDPPTLNLKLSPSSD